METVVQCIPEGASITGWVTAAGTVGAVAVALGLGVLDRRRSRKDAKRSRALDVQGEVGVLGEVCPNEDTTYQGLVRVSITNHSRGMIYAPHAHYRQDIAGEVKQGVVHFEDVILPKGSTKPVDLPDREPEHVLQSRPLEYVFRTADETWWRRDRNGDLHVLRADCHPLWDDNGDRLSGTTP